jgi:hypothetical protein
MDDIVKRGTIDHHRPIIVSGGLHCQHPVVWAMMPISFLEARQRPRSNLTANIIAVIICGSNDKAER